MIYRESVNGDIPELIELSRLFDTSPYSFDRHIKEITDSTYPAFAYDMLLAPASETIVAQENDSLSGFITFSFNFPLSNATGRKTGNILLLAVTPEFRGKGIGKRLVEKAMEKLGSLGVKTVAVGTDLYNYPAIQVYESCGFHFRMGWHIFRYYPGSDGNSSRMNREIGPPEGPEIESFLKNLSRPISLLKERNYSRALLLDYLTDNARRNIYKGKSKCYILRSGSKPAGFINITTDDICKRTLMTDRTVYKILDVIVAAEFKNREIEAEMLSDIKSRLEDYCLLELWIDAENAELIDAAEDAGYHLSYTGAAFHWNSDK
jgi:ribosomal protein S18 acetylase RimI-like enzyme